MKNIITAVGLLLAGLTIGWILGRQVSQKWIREEFSRVMLGLPPHVINTMESAYDLFTDMDQEEIDTLLQHMQQYGKNQVDESRISKLYNALLAERLRKHMGSGDTNQVIQVLSDLREQFVRAVEAGDYIGTEWEGVAATLASRWRKQ